MDIHIPHEFFEKASRWHELKRLERREIGQELRRLGLSYGEIMQVIPVTKGTLSGWCQAIPLTDEQIERIGSRGWRSAAAQEKAAAARRQANIPVRQNVL